MMAVKKQRIYLIRHGETEFNRLGIFRGRYEVELNDSGRSQAGETGRALKDEDISFILTGPLVRTLETARIVAGEIGVEYRVDEAFNNIALGKWQGVEKDKVKREFPEMWKLWISEPEKLKLPGGESVEEVRQRATRRLLEVVEEEDASFAVVTHRSVIKGLAASLMGVAAPYFWKFYIDNAAYSVFENDGVRFVLHSWNKNEHLTSGVTETF
jgi:broad specificity phosphatase PhoE